MLAYDDPACLRPEYFLHRGSNFFVFPQLPADAIYCIPQLSGGNFSYTRLPRVSRCVVSSPPIGGAFAVPSEVSPPSAQQLRPKHQAQSLLFGRAPTAVDHVPPPPGRGRSHARGTPKVRNDPPVSASFVGSEFVRPKGFLTHSSWGPPFNSEHSWPPGRKSCF